MSNLHAKLERSLGFYCHMLSNCTREYKTHVLLLSQSMLCWAQDLTEPTFSPPSLNTNLGCLSSARAYACIKPCVELELSLPDLFKLGFSLTCRSVTRKVLLYHLIIDRRNKSTLFILLGPSYNLIRYNQWTQHICKTNQSQTINGTEKQSKYMTCKIFTNYMFNKSGTH